MGRSARPLASFRHDSPRYLSARTSPLTSKTGIYGQVPGTPPLLPSPRFVPRENLSPRLVALPLIRRPRPDDRDAVEKFLFPPEKTRSGCRSVKSATGERKGRGDFHASSPGGGDSIRKADRFANDRRKVGRPGGFRSVPIPGHGVITQMNRNGRKSGVLERTKRR